MLAKQELREKNDCKNVWIGRYKNSHNLPHWHEESELIYIESGILKIFYRGNEYVIQTGQTFYIGSEEVHSMQSMEETYALVFIFNAKGLLNLEENFSLSSPILKKEYPIEKTYSLIKEELKNKKYLFEHFIENIMSSLLLQIYRKELTETKTFSKRENNFQSLLEEIEKNYVFYSFEDAAKFMNMSEAYFSRTFHKLTGMTFSQYLNYIKVEKSIELLQKNTNITITDISMQCGFSTIKNFNRIFKKLTGYTPKSLPNDYKFEEKIFIINNNFNPTLNETVLMDN